MLSEGIHRKADERKPRYRYVEGLYVRDVDLICQFQYDNIPFGLVGLNYCDGGFSGCVGDTRIVIRYL